ncbi:polyprenyl synthetase family protein [Streptomyces sp. NPDC006624]|uniref:polyprenyl synthetase family protein n=1 Tax=Streptomyces sp. NPDC006624 TaxID=3154892 RepID=UPI0033BF92E9
MGESLTESRTETTLPAPGGQRAEPWHPARSPHRRGLVTARRGSRPEPAEAHEAVVLLERARAEVDPVLRAAIDSLPGPMRRVALHHFGWDRGDGFPGRGGSGKGSPVMGGSGNGGQDKGGPGNGGPGRGGSGKGRPVMGGPANGSPGKGGSGSAIRPALVLVAAAALGGSEARARAVRAAAAVELVHHCTLLHDYTMDRDAVRRHRPTAWTVFGDADAILAGDALQALALRLLAEDPHPASSAAAARLADCVVELCAGRHADTAMERRGPGEVTLDEVLAMAEAKTGALLGGACAIGALYAGAGAADVAALDAFGREAGLAFQLIDDVIGLWGDPGRTGKPVGADPAARSKSLPVVAALTSGSPEAAGLAELSARPGGKVDLEHLALTVERAGGRDWAQEQAADRMARAVQQLARAVPDPEAAGGLLALAEFVTRRGS